MMGFSEEGVLKARTGLELGLLHQTVNQGVKAKRALEGN